MADMDPEVGAPESLEAEPAAEYAPPLDRLLSYGEEPARAPEWPDYVAELGLTEEHIPELVRIVTDEVFHHADSTGTEVWAQLHAWRALGQLRAEAAVEPLLGLLDEASEADDDWALEELPRVFGKIGPAAIPALVQYVEDPEHDLWAHLAAVRGFKEIAQSDPSQRDEVVGILAGWLETHAERDSTLNAYLIYYLSDLQATEAAPVMERAFAAEDVDLSVAGDWEDVQIKLGLLEERLTPRPRLRGSAGLPEPRSMPRQQAAQQQLQKKVKKNKSRKKLAKQSRKQNRKRR